METSNSSKAKVVKRNINKWIIMILVGLSGVIRESVAQVAVVDILHYDLNIYNLDYSGRKIKASATINFTLAQPKDTLQLDLWGLTVDSVTGVKVKGFYQKDPKLFVLFEPILASRDEHQVTIHYSGQPKQDATWGGFFFSGVYCYNIGVGFTSDPQNFGRVWFPCVDNFTDKATFGIHVTVPDGYKAFCSGSLDSISENSSKKIWNWSIKQPIATYLASMAVAPYALHQYSHKGIKVNLTCLPADSQLMVSSFENLPGAIDAFISGYGPHYFDRIGYNVVPFNGGAMEHATNIAYPKSAIDGLKSSETLFAHELAHHWWGNNVTCTEAQFMWINEAWAAYSERVFLEWVYGRDRYRESVSSNHKNVLHYCHLRDDKAWPVSGVDHDHTYGMTVYQKGADMIHTLRSYMGDSAFFDGCKDFMTTYKFGNANTTDLKNIFQKHTSKNLDYFFKYWIESPGFPAFYILESNSSKQGLSVKTDLRIKQTLKLAPEFYRGVPVEVRLFDKDMKSETHTVLVSGEDSTYSVLTPFNPVYIALDFDEKLSDAVTDKWFMAKEKKAYNMGDALMTIDVKELKDSALLRVEHYWVSPDHYYLKTPGVQLSNRRYWSVDGIWPQGFNATAQIEYNGRVTGTNYAIGYLDDDLPIPHEDSLVLLYRPHAAANWALMSDATKAIGGTALDKKGTFTINNLKKGQYAFGVWNSKTSGIAEPLATISMKVFPNPSDGLINFKFEPLADEACLEITDMTGKVVKRMKLKGGETQFQMKEKQLKPGMYFAGISVHCQSYDPVRFVIK